MTVESNWDPWPPNESGHKEAKPAQPHRLQKVNRSDGQWSKWASDIQQLQPDQWNSHSSRWHSFAGDKRSWKHKEYESSEWDGSKWSAPTSRTLGGPEYDTDKEWQLRSMRYGDGWAYDSTHSHYKRAKPTDLEDDRNADPSLPMGSTSKTYDPREDGSFWKRTDGGQEWSHSSSSSGYWRPRMRHERCFSSAAGDASEASTATNALGSIRETDGDAVRAWSDKPAYRW